MMFRPDREAHRRKILLTLNYDANSQQAIHNLSMPISKNTSQSSGLKHYQQVMRQNRQSRKQLGSNSVENNAKFFPSITKYNYQSSKDHDLDAALMNQLHVLKMGQSGANSSFYEMNLQRLRRR